MSTKNRFKKSFHSWAWLILIAFLCTGIFYPPIGIIAVICMLAPPVGALFNGRTTCSWLCPRGSFLDVIAAKISCNKNTPRLFYNNIFRLIVFITIMAVFLLQIIPVWGNIAGMGKVFITMIYITTSIGIILAAAFKPRAWCTFCPMGTMGNWVARLRNNSYISIDKDTCVSCAACERICPMQFAAYKYKDRDKIHFYDCLRCGKCDEKCPTKSIKLIIK